MISLIITERRLNSQPKKQESKILFENSKESFGNQILHEEGLDNGNSRR